MAAAQELSLFEKKFRAMGSPCDIKFFATCAKQAAAAMRAAIARVQVLERKYSRYQDDTITSRINHAAGTQEWVDLDQETYQLLRLAEQGYQLSEGLFDITSGILRQVWDFKLSKRPSADALAAVLPRIGWHHVCLRQNGMSAGAAENPDAPAGWAVQLPRQGMEVDFGGLVKEYAADAASTVLRAHGVTSGIVDLGGDLSIIGPHPQQGRWSIGVRDPRAPSHPISLLGVDSGAVATSGDYERFFEQNGRRYCHILNPKTGWPTQGFSSVTVVAQPCVVAGMAATIAMLKGVSCGIQWLQDLGVPFLAVTAPLTNQITGVTKPRQILTEQSTSAEIEQVLEVLTD